MRALVSVFWKELADHFSSVRFLILFALVYLAGLFAAYTSVQTIRDIVNAPSALQSEAARVMPFLKLYTTSGEVLPPFTIFITLFIPIIGIALGFDAINRERASGTMSKVLSQPIYRDAVINGKFLAGVVTMSILLISIVILIAGMGLRLLGVPPSSEEVLRLMAFLGLSIVYGAFWLGLAMLFSILFQRAATSVLACIAVWIFFLFFSGIIAGAIADSIVPLSENSPPEIVVQRESVARSISLVSPSTLYEEPMNVLLNPVTRTLGPILVKQASWMIPNPLSFSQSLLLVWPDITGLLALTAICFGISYIKFMREEIRST